MNLPIAAVGVLMFVAFFAHVLAGLRETMSIRPSLIISRESAADLKVEALERNWSQALCAFQMVTVDLLALTVVSLLLAFTDIIANKRPVAIALAVFFALWGVAWLVQLAWLRTARKNYLLLGHWVFWFVCAGLMYWGAQSL